MLTSLFGELDPPKGPDGGAGRGGDAPPHGFAATDLLEAVATEMNARGQMVDRHSRDLVISGSPAQAIREHFAATRSDLDAATSLITLLDPLGIWASAVIKALSDAGGRPIERLHLREHGTLRTLATIERTTLVRRHEDTLRIYHADVHASGAANAEIPTALMERSQMTTVIVGALTPQAIDALLEMLRTATRLPNWRCPHLLFMLPPAAVWIANKIGSIAWPERLHVHVLSEPMTGASSVWNAMLGMWNQVKTQPGFDTTDWRAAHGRDAPHGDSPSDAADRELPPPGAVRTAAPRIRHSLLDPARARQALAPIRAVDGLLACALVDATTGVILAKEVGATRVETDIAAIACAQVLRAHRQAARSIGLAEPLDEVIARAATRQHVLRPVTRHPELFLMLLLDRPDGDLTQARARLEAVDLALT